MYGHKLARTQFNHEHHCWVETARMESADPRHRGSKQLKLLAYLHDNAPEDEAGRQDKCTAYDSWIWRLLIITSASDSQ
jgi:hypothetical protein